MSKKVHEETNQDFISMVSKQFEYNDSASYELLQALRDYEIPGDLTAFEISEHIYNLNWDNYDVISLSTKSGLIGKYHGESKENLRSRSHLPPYTRSYGIKAGIYLVSILEKNDDDYRSIDLIREHRVNSL
ncbi:hypothetical protein [Paenibacillus sp. PAMC 26794]|uniref:hypothetical protein n=1 Tax=Paenibacillus sp. PAMC 26794 TaxID=1257080 RepID=UPI0004748A5F|nr:hypothetical protein [Paenibacillus sp. PAMC 26794]